jgi:hypothetical protein
MDTWLQISSVGEPLLGGQALTGFALADGLHQLEESLRKVSATHGSGRGEGDEAE